MRYFEFDSPYALIRAKSEDNAIMKYVSYGAKNDKYDRELTIDLYNSNIEEISRDVALVRYAAASGSLKGNTAEDILESFNEDYESVLLYEVG